ncbi:MAG: UDP-N-acetylglucosamine 1-carboxyvinyltransferase, partial [Firmicutes bacterium]|nr:UDP-N-acetylglucosamine 1-carboxyvinyltransferase [Bacillota bacterium]
MGYFTVYGTEMPVSGEVTISGAKNAALPELAAAVLCERAVLENCPKLSDTQTAAEILEKTGFSFKREGKTVFITPNGGENTEVSKQLCGKMRSSVLFLAPLLCRCGRAAVYMPGGCCLGARPVDLHIYALERLGAKVECGGEKICARAPNGLNGAEITLPLPSVGATETAIMAAACARGESIVKNPAIEPEIEDLCRFLNSAGADISFGKEIKIRGQNGLLGRAKHRVMPDRIEAGTYLAAAAITGGELYLKNAGAGHISAFIKILEDMGCIIKTGDGQIYIDAPARLYLPDLVETAPYPAFPTDLQPQLTALMAVKRGKCTVRENIFESRLGHIPQLMKMGADIEILDNSTFTVNGLDGPFIGKNVRACDLRCGAALLLAGL